MLERDADLGRSLHTNLPLPLASTPTPSGPPRVSGPLGVRRTPRVPTALRQREARGKGLKRREFSGA